MIMKKIITASMLSLLLGGTVQAQSLPVYLDDSKPIEDRIEDALSRITVEEKVALIHAQSKFSSPGVARLGIPEFWMTDGPHGIRPEVLWDEWNQAGWTNDSCVAFPALTCLAATWNPEAALLYGQSIGEEARYRNKTVLLGPGVNIYRTPLNGRNFEYMGEDPYLASQMVVPYVKGVQQNGVAACVKHYALNNQEINRHTTNVIVDDRALYEIYLPAFKAAVQKGKAWAIMGSYNLYKNQHNCHNRYLLNDILKGEWGFDGVVVSDWGGVHNTEEAIYNGMDMKKLSQQGKKQLLQEFSLPSDAFIVGHTGRCNEAKNHDTILKVASELCHRHKDIHFVLVGKGVREKYEMIVQQMGLDGQIHLLGYRSDVLRILPLFDLYYFPSLTEGQPNALIEAMATGLPFVASDIASIKESVPVEMYSLLLSPCDAEKAVKVIERIYKGEVNRDKYRCKEWAQKCFNADDLFAKFRKEL